MYTTYTGVMGSALTTTDTVNVGCCDGGSGLSSRNGLLFQGSKITLPGISDGSSNTWIVGEQSGHVRDAAGVPVGVITSQGPHGWAMGCDSNTPANGSRVFNCTAVRYEINRIGIVSNTTSGAATGVNNNTGQNIPFSSNHTGGANMLAADGTVRFFTNSTPLLTLSALCTRDGGEAVSMEP